MSKFKTIIAKNWVLILIILLATLLRFYDYQNRWVFNQDQARDITMAHFALRNNKIPLVGSPSSAGPFNFGALYDWLVIGITFLFPFISGSWVAFTLLSTFCVFIFYKIGDNLVNKKLGLIMALLSAISPSLVLNSTDMLNTVAVLFAVCLNFYVLSLYFKKPKNIYLFFLGFTVGLANNFHFQSLGFGSVLIAFLLINLKNIKQLIYHTILIGIGYIVSFLPNIIFDLLNNFVWIKSVATYYLGGGTDKFYYPVRWLIDIRDFWPQLWGNTITGFGSIGYILILIYLLVLPKLFKQKRLNKYNLILLISLIIQVLLLRYYKGVRSREYLITFHSYFIILTAIALNYLSKNIFILITVLLVLASTISCSKIVLQKSQAQEILSIYKDVNQDEVDMYTLNGSSQVNLPLFYLFYRQNKIDSQKGYKIATCISKDNLTCPDSGLIIAKSDHYILYDINSLTPNQLANYFQFTPQIIYNWLYINYPDAKNY